MFSAARKTKTLFATLHRNVFRMNLALIALIGCLGLLYVVQINSATTKGYRMRDIETQISQYEFDNERLEVMAADARSMDRVMRGVQMLGMVRSETPNFLAVGAPSVAMNQ